jgi:L-ascorbate metabolism protein UlaG (beta-lactamase superfamily)
MERTMITGSLLLASLLAAAQPVTATFIGNCAFRIELGEWTLFSDFPYQSGYSGYNTYTLPEDFRTVRGTALVTHAHLDHFDSALFGTCRLELIAPHRSMAEQEAALARMEERGIHVYPIPTEHADMPHASYIVAVRGRRLYFTGDTEDPTELLRAKDLDVAFVTPWSIATINAIGRRIDARTVIMYHHEADQFKDRTVQAPCDRCRFVIPQQGEVIELFK